MTQTRKRRQRKHKGTQAGTIERSAERGGGGDRSRGGARAGARQGRLARLDRPPTWTGALTRAAIAAAIFAIVVIALFDESVQAGVTLAAFMLLIYIPMSYYTDRFIYNRRQRSKAESGAGGAGGGS